MLNENQLVVLAYIVSLKSFARNEYIERAGLGTYNVGNPIVQSLVEQKFLTVNKAGSIMPDRNKINDTLKTYTHPQVSMPGINSYWLFKRNGE